jgi:HSP20 family protein
MADTTTKVPVKNETKETAAPTAPGWWPFDPSWRRQFDRFFDQFPYPAWRAPALVSRSDFEPFWRQDAASWGMSPAVDIAEKENAYEVTAELPGLTEKNIDVKYADGVLTIKGEKQETKEEKKKDYHLSERRFGSFRRSFSVPTGIDADKIVATFDKGVLTVTLPKTPEAVKQEKKIPITQSK